MSPLLLPWLEVAIGLSLLGALCISWLRDPNRAARWALAFTGIVFACTFLMWLGSYLHISFEQPSFFARPLFQVDELSAPLIPAVALLHFLTTLATTRTKMRRFSFSWSLTNEALRLAIFGCREPWVLIGLLILSVVPPYFELINRGKPTRVYVLHMALFGLLLVLGWSVVEIEGKLSEHSVWSTVPLLAAILVRCGMVPFHCWLTDWLEHASFGIALLFVAPLSGVYAAIRLVLPIAPDWMLQGLGLIALTTAVYAAGMAVIQRDARRFFAFLFLSHIALVLVGLELSTPISLTGALSLWFSAMLALGGFGLVLRAMEGRFGRMTLTQYHGLYDSSPALAVCFLLTGLACVGFPGTLGFVSTDLIVDGAVEANLYVGLAVVLATALNGIAVVRAYFLLFTGARHSSTVSLRVGPRERFAILALSALLLGGGLIPQPGVHSRHLAAEQLLQEREALRRGRKLTIWGLEQHRPRSSHPRSARRRVLV